MHRILKYACAERRSHDCPQVDEKELVAVDTLEVKLGGTGDMSGWVGGRVVLVPTDKPIDQWVPIAERVI